MTWDTDALLRALQEAERSMAIATSRIVTLEERIAFLEAENQRLRIRLAGFGERMRRMEQGEL
jgi:uncharacterized protein YcfL